MMDCKFCVSPKTEMRCEPFVQMQRSGRWQWEIDNGQRICRCPECGFGNLIGVYADHNPYRYCPSCGKQMVFGEQTMF